MNNNPAFVIRITIFTILLCESFSFLILHNNERNGNDFRYGRHPQQKQALPVVRSTDPQQRQSSLPFSHLSQMSLPVMNRKDDDFTEKYRNKGSSEWIKMDEIARIQSPWITVIAERLKDNERDLVMDYWRIERADSAIVIVVQGNSLIFPKPQFRPGIGKCTLDFPGGRIRDGQRPVDAAKHILWNELGITEDDFLADKGGILELNDFHHGWYVDSSVSSQKLHGFVVHVREDGIVGDQNKIHHRIYSLDNDDDRNQLLKEDLMCLQCRSILMEWMMLKGKA